MPAPVQPNAGAPMTAPAYPQQLPPMDPSWSYGQSRPDPQQSPQTAPYPQPAPYAQPMPPVQSVPAARPAPQAQPALYCYTQPPVPLSTPTAESEQEEGAFGRPGQFVLWGGGAIFSGTRIGSSDNRPSATASMVDLAPSFGFFLSKTLLLEAAAHIWRQSDSLQTQYGFGLETGLGFNVPLSRLVSLLPEVRVGIGWAESSCFDYYGCNDQSNLQYWNGLGMPILFHLAPHLFIGAGPAVKYTFMKSDDYDDVPNALNFSLQALIGGWL